MRFLRRGTFDWEQTEGAEPIGQHSTTRNLTPPGNRKSRTSTLTRTRLWPHDDARNTEREGPRTAIVSEDLCSHQDLGHVTLLSQASYPERWGAWESVWSLTPGSDMGTIVHPRSVLEIRLILIFLGSCPPVPRWPPFSLLTLFGKSLLALSGYSLSHAVVKFLTMNMNMNMNLEIAQRWLLHMPTHADQNLVIFLKLFK